MDKKYFAILIGALLIVAVAWILPNPFQVVAGYPYLRTGQEIVTTTAMAVQLDTLAIPRDVHFLVKAMATNTAKIAIGYSAATAITTGTDCFFLDPGESIGLNISNANLLWIGGVAGAGVEYITEFTY